MPIRSLCLTTQTGPSLARPDLPLALVGPPTAALQALRPHGTILYG